MLSSISKFIKFQNDFENLLNKLINEYEKLKKYFYKILFIKDIYENKDDNKQELLEIDNYYYNDHIINRMNEIINAIKDTILIKEEYPKIKHYNELISQTNDLLISMEINKFNLNIIKKDFEYFNLKKKNCSVKKIIKFEITNNNEINIIRDRKLFKLNKELEPACFILSYTERKDGLNNSYIKVYDKKINLLFIKFIYSQRIRNIIQLKNNSILLILSKKIFIIKLNNNTIDIIQEFEKMATFYFEMLLDNGKISLLIPTNTKNHFFLKNEINNNDNIYLSQQVLISSPILSENSYHINKYNFINTYIRHIFFYHINYKNNDNQKCYEIEIIKDNIIQAKDLLNYGIQFINNHNFVISGLNYIYLVSFPYKEIISIFSYFGIDRIYNGYQNECYLLLNAWIYKHKLIRQINFNENYDNKKAERGEIIVEGQTYLEDPDFYNRYFLIDLEDKICYIKVNKKEDDEIEYGCQYNKD